MYTGIIEQLKSYCDCLKESDVKATNFESNIMQMINLLSTLLCWKSDTCDTFLLSERVEHFQPLDLDTCKCCDTHIMQFTLFYQLVRAESIDVTVKIRDGIHFRSVSVSKEDFSFNECDNTLWIDFKNYDLPTLCDCDKVECIEVKYDAGYELLPDCLLPIFCDYLSYVIEMNRCKCGCDVCEQEEGNYDDIINYDSSEEQLTAYIAVREHVIAGYKRQLEAMSLCESHRFYGKVI